MRSRACRGWSRSTSTRPCAWRPCSSFPCQTCAGFCSASASCSGSGCGGGRPAANTRRLGRISAGFPIDSWNRPLSEPPVARLHSLCLSPRRYRCLIRRRLDEPNCARIRGAPGTRARVLRRSFARIEPVLGDTEIVLPEQRRRIEPLEEKIVTLRLAAPPLERFEGRRLIEALQAVGLQHGKFSIFHRATPDGATIFSVASLVEPGTFDLDQIAGPAIPRVSACLPSCQDRSRLRRWSRK